MKKLLALIMPLFVLLFAASAVAEETDLSSISFEELCDLKTNVDAELYSRPEAEPFILEPGVYIIGEDLKPARYHLMFNQYYFNVSCVSWYGVYKDFETYTSDGEALFVGYISLTDAPITIPLETGNCIRIGLLPLMFSVNSFTEKDQCVYEAPEGTYVPAGLYTVGNDIPVGTYKVYMASLDGYDIFIYENEEAYKNKEYTELLETMVVWDDHVRILTAREGNIVRIDDDVVFVKQEKPIF